MIDVEFFLSVHNRTGKYYLGLEIIEALGSRVGTVLYGRLNAPTQPDLLRRIFGRLYHWETKVHAFMPWLGVLIPKIRPQRPVLHLDPLTVLNHRMENHDIVLCHDVGPITFPEYFHPGTGPLYQRAYADIARAACHLVFVSKTTQREFHRFYGTDFASSTVIYIPTRLAMTSKLPKPPADAPNARRYFLTVGSLGDRKNQVGTIEAFDQSGLSQKGYEYIIVGSDEPGAEAVHKLARQTPGVRVLGYVSDEELVWLYQNATAFVLMSKLEGFGMPVVEAAVLDLPCIVTRSGILEEVGGPSSLSAEVDNTQEIAAQMNKLAAMAPHERKGLALATLEYARLHFDRDEIFSAWRTLIDTIS